MTPHVLSSLLLPSIVAAYGSYYPHDPMEPSENAMRLPLVLMDGNQSQRLPPALPAVDPPSFVDASDPPSLSFDPVANWIRLTERNQAKLSLLINECLKTTCKDYMHECHWYCDPMKGIAERRWLCDECLGPYIRLCGKCFEA